MRNALLFALGVFVLGCSGSSATPIDPPSGTPSGSSSGSSSGGTATSTATPPDSSFAGASSGCANVITYRANADGTQYLVVRADRAKIALEMSTIRTFDLAHLPDGLDVAVDVFARPPSEAPYCTDWNPATPAASWSAEGGSLTIQLQPGDPGTSSYRATVRLKDVRLVGPERGVAISIPRAEIANVLVGWLPG